MMMDGVERKRKEQSERNVMVAVRLHHDVYVFSVGRHHHLV